MRIQLSLAVLMVAAILSSPIAAKSGPRDIMCNAVSKTPEGMFTYRQLPGLSVVQMVSRPGPFTLADAANVVSLSCARTSLIPVVNDVKVLQAGYALSIGAQRGGVIELVSLEIKDGRVVANTRRATLTSREARDLDQSVRAMQAIVDSAPVHSPR